MEVITPAKTSKDFKIETPIPTHFEEYYLSNPSSPTQISQFYREFDEFLINNSRNDVARGSSVSSTVPFHWEEKPGVPKTSNSSTTNTDDFAFDLSQEMDTVSLSAEELFNDGKIRPLKPPSRSKLRPQTVPGSFSPRHKKSVSRREEHERGRERSSGASLSSSKSRHRATRSLSPLRVSEYPWEEEFRKLQEPPQQENQQTTPKQSTTNSLKPTLTSTTSSVLSSPSPKKWKLKDFFLFRSASEGRARDKDSLKKYGSVLKKHEDVRSSSFRSIDSSASSSGSSSRRRGTVSAHELHYTVNRAVSDDMKKKTFLPYKQGLLGSLAINPAAQAVSNGFGLSPR